MQKISAALGSALPDPMKSYDTVSPVPSPVVENKTAPGQRGPIGLSPRTTYSRVNTGSPPAPEAGVAAQKSNTPRGMEFLPAKTAQIEDYNMATRPMLQEMLKAAMAGTASKIDITNEAVRQLHYQYDEPEKVSEAVPASHYSTEHISKLASALDFIAEQMKVADSGDAQMPGQGPGALQVMQATSSGTSLDAGESGQATGQHQAAPSELQAEQVQSGKANTGLKTNDDTTHGEQPVDPWANEKASLQNAQTKQSEALFARNIDRLTKVGAEGTLAERAGAAVGNQAPNIGTAMGGLGGLGGGAAVGKALGGTKGALIGGALGAVGGGLLGRGAGYFGRGMTRGTPEHQAAKVATAGVNVNLIRKLAADSEDHANISSGAAVPPPAVPAEQGVPPVPSDVSSQERLISSNQAAINYTKQQAKADPKSDLRKVLNEPALSSATDKVLQKSWDHTGEAGVKISHQKKTAGLALPIGALATAGGGYMGYTSGRRQASEGEEKPEWGPGKYLGSVIIPPYGAYQVGRTIGYNNRAEELEDRARAASAADQKTAMSKMASDTTRVAAARALLSNMLEKVAEKPVAKKSKQSEMGAVNTSPQAAMPMGPASSMR